MTVAANVISVNVNAEVNSALVTISVQIGNKSEVTSEAVHEALGISEEGSADKFLNEQGDFIEIEAGESEAEFQLSVLKSDCQFKGDWIKIAHTEATNAKRVIVRRATVEDSNGEQELDLMIAYPAAETYTGANIYQGFYIQDRNGLLSKTADWDVLNLDYDVEADTQTKYSFLNHETGINVICSHRKDYYISEQDKDVGNEMHAMSMRCMFTSVFPEFEGDFIDTYIDPEANYSDLATSFEPTYYEKNRASILMKPYSYAAWGENYSSSADFLEIGSHGYNSAIRKNLTAKADIFLSHSIAVGAKKENDWQTAPQTTYGYGVEFFEITEMSYLEAQYTERGERLYPHIAMHVFSNADRTVIWTSDRTNELHQTFLNNHPDSLKVGDIVFINVPLEAPTFGGTHPAEWQFWYNPASIKRTIIDKQTIDGTTYFTLDGAIWDTQLTGNKYIWSFAPAAYTAGNVTGSTQSPATMIVGAKFAKIKQATGLGLRLIREACRATAVLANDTTATSQSYSGATTSINVADTTEFPEEGIIRVNGYEFVYTSKTADSFVGLSQSVICESGATVTLKWDIYRGFGQIDVDAAIAYLEDNYLNNDDYKATVQRPKVNPVLDYTDLGDNDAMPKRLTQPAIEGSTVIDTDIVNRLFYNADEDTVSYIREDGGTRELGKEISDIYTNIDTVEMVNGDVVSIVGVSGNRSAVKLTDATDDTLALATIGIVTVDSIPVNNGGEVAKVGKVRGLNTSSYTEGDLLYADQSNPGKLTSTKPTSGRIIEIGVVLVKHATVGVIDLKINTLPLASDLGAEETSNKVTTLSGTSTDTEYPSAKCVWDLVGDVESILEELL